jgi:hypothetical protein
MAEDAKYGHVEIPNKPDDMPVFILLAADKNAVPTLARYRNFQATIEDESLRPSQDWFDGMDALIETFSDWQRDNPTLVKVAD